VETVAVELLDDCGMIFRAGKTDSPRQTRTLCFGNTTRSGNHRLDAVFASRMRSRSELHKSGVGCGRIARVSLSVSGVAGGAVVQPLRKVSNCADGRNELNLSRVLDV
jgi:hypothetical protein